MKRSPSRLVAGLLLVRALPISAQPAPDKPAPAFQVADGLRLELLAAEPMLVHPTCIDIAPRGRVWVCEAAGDRAGGGRILVLEDVNGDGKANRATTFYQAADFRAPRGFAVVAEPSKRHPGRESYRVYVGQTPNILLLEDQDGDGQLDGEPRVLLTGFGGQDPERGVGGITLGPNGRLYITAGDEGVPRDIPVFDGYRAILLGPPSYPRSWRSQRDFQTLRADLVVERTLTRDEVRAWLARFAGAPRP